ncbi:MAG: insulinase family protein [Bacteroidales bacterium]|nr:insulinase family protein [Bacteroidales bacterium]
MTYNYHRLANGIRIIHKPVNSAVSHIGLVVNTGTRDEEKTESGIAHFIEHVIFKGTNKRNTYQVLSYLENIGGDLNAYTTKEETFFYASVLNDYIPRALELLTDIVFNSTFVQKDLDTEKEVVIEEIQLCKDTPSEWIFDEFENMLFAGHSLGTNILGTVKSVKQITREKILNFTNRTYNTDQIVLAVVGNIDLKHLIKLANFYLADIKENIRKFQRPIFQNFTPQQRHIKIRSNQTHAIMGSVLPAYDETKNQIATLLLNILGGQGLNSRLNMAVREKKGYVYNIEANYAPMSDIGLFTIYIGCDSKNLDKCFSLISKELNKLKRQKLGTLQLHRAHRQLIGQMYITYESNLTEMLSIGKNNLIFDTVEPIESISKKIEKISSEELIDLSNEIFDENNFSRLIIGK